MCISLRKKICLAWLGRCSRITPGHKFYVFMTHLGLFTIQRINSLLKRNGSLLVMLHSLLMLGGCATSRSVLDVPPIQAGASSAANGKEVFINSARDKRMFLENPSEPNIPSLDPSEAQDANIKLRSVARKRNTFGKALGDIVLKEGQTVESLTSAAIRQAFIEKGYRVVDSKDKVTPNTQIVDANISKFWSWMNPGFASITLSTEISTDLTIKAPDGLSNQTISVKAADNFQTGMDGNWLEVINKAIRAYVDELKAKLK